MRVLAGRYRLDELIGRGGMGQVWHGWDVTLHRRVAVKLLHDDQPHDPRAAGRFLNEARLSAGLAHPGIVTVHDLDREPDGTVYLVMELLTGTDLAVRLRRDGPPPVAEALDWMLQLCDALAFAHTAKVIHRDLKPANLFLAPNGRLKVLDFGIAKYAEGFSDSHSRVMGTTAYMPPERFHGRSGDHRGDLYSLGCVLFEFLTGRPPFGTGAPAALMMRHLTEPARPAGPEAPGPVPPELDRLVLDLLAKEPGDRPRSAAEVTARLRPLSAAPAAPVRTPTERDAPRLRTPTAPVTLLDPPAHRPGPGQDEYADRIRSSAAGGRLPLLLRELARGGAEYRSDPWIAAAARAWPAAELAALLGAYDTAGRADLADRLATLAATRRDPAELPALFAGMSEAGQRDRLHALSARFGTTRTEQPAPPVPAPASVPASRPGPVSGSGRVPGADAGETEYAEWIRALDAAGRLAGPERELAHLIRSRQSDAWVAAAARAWPAERIGELLALYQSGGRNDLASRIVRSVPEHRDPTELPAVLSGLRTAGQDQRIVMLLSAARRRGARYVGAARAALAVAGEGPLAEALGRTREIGRPDPLESVLYPDLYPAAKQRPVTPAPTPTPAPVAKQPRAAGRLDLPAQAKGAHRPGKAEQADRISSLAAEGRLPGFREIADFLGDDGLASPAWVDTVARTWPAERLGELFAKYDRSGQGRVADRILRHLLVRREPAELPALVAGLRAAHQYERLYALLDGVRGQLPADRAALLAALDGAGEHTITVALRTGGERALRAAVQAPATQPRTPAGRAPGQDATEVEYVRWIRSRHAAGELPPPERMLARHGYGYESAAWASAVAQAWPAEQLAELLAVYRRTGRSRLAGKIARRFVEQRGGTDEHALVVRALRQAGQHVLLDMMRAVYEAGRGSRIAPGAEPGSFTARPPITGDEIR
ncbi:hypothetical protein GCM10009759_60550 [Kitasatospora saccharophila]|uniref:non-specific serine/threonine protein kinase n=1 Tax=Kitasatospora saccharophila TaxID=407973 RepID=A0ABN2XQB9_9ACTN